MPYPFQPMNDDTLRAHIEGLLFGLGKPLSRDELLKMLAVEPAQLESAIATLQHAHDRGIVVVDDGTTIELRTAPVVAELMEHIRRDELGRDVGRAGLEVLAAIIYRGPLTRTDIDFIRGVNSSQTIRTLATRGLIRRVQNTKGSFLYEATTETLAEMGATHPRDLPAFDTTREKLTALENAYRGTHEDHV